MHTKMDVNFTMELAGVTFDVWCRYPDTQRLCHRFLTAPAEPAVPIVVDQAAIEKERACYPAPDSDAAVERQCLCRLLAHHLSGCGTALFHSSALMFDGQAVLFTAPSGTGKSTHTSLWRRVYGSRVRMINDDKPFVGFLGAVATVYGSPWQGKHNLGENISAPLKAICVVTRGQENLLQRLTPREAFPLLLQQVYRPEEAALVAGVLSWTNRIVTDIPVYRLTCNMEPEAAITACRRIFGEESSKP